MITDKDLGWAAGIIEGEGCIILKKAVNKFQGRIQVNMTDEDVLIRLATILGVGTLIKNKLPTNHFKPSWRYTIAKQKDVISVLTALYPLLGLRRKEQADKVLTYFNYNAP